MKPSLKILIAFSFVSMALLLSGFYYSMPDRHNPCIFPEKMNVFYIGVDNPVTISACGLAPTDFRPVITGGSMTMTRPGKYIVRVTGGTKATISILMDDSEKVSLGSFEYRIKRVPDPVAYFGNLKADGMMTKGEILNNTGIFARMENFDFDLKFNVISFCMLLVEKGQWKEYKSTDNLLTPEMKSALKGTMPGDMIFFQKVTVKGPDGTLRKIPGVMINVK